MLKLNASYSKKVPADGEYTSQSYHASIEVELPDKMLEYLHKQEKITVPKQKNTCISQLGVSVAIKRLPHRLPRPQPFRRQIEPG